MHLSLRTRSGIKLVMWLAVVLSILNLTSCSTVPADPSVSPIASPSGRNGDADSPLAHPTRSASDASSQDRPSLSTPALTGVLTSASVSRPLANVPVRLAEVFWDEDQADGAYILNTAQSPATITDQEGFFAFEDLDPNDYVLVVGEIPGDNVIVSNPDGSARVFTAERDKVTDAGQITVDVLAENP